MQQDVGKDVRDSNWIVDVLLLPVLVLDLHVVQAQVDLHILLQVIIWSVSVRVLRFYFLKIKTDYFKYRWHLYMAFIF